MKATATPTPGVRESGEDQPATTRIEHHGQHSRDARLGEHQRALVDQAGEADREEHGETDGRAAVAEPRSHEVTREYPQRHTERQLDRARKPSRRGRADRDERGDRREERPFVAQGPCRRPRRAGGDCRLDPGQEPPEQARAGLLEAGRERPFPLHA
jgi:hypothetical protein